MHTGHVAPDTEKRLLLSVLNAWEKDGTAEESPWHITEKGWAAYTTHANTEIREAALKNRFCNCPEKDLQYRRMVEILNRKIFS